jgi:hypothetical protein
MTFTRFPPFYARLLSLAICSCLCGLDSLATAQEHQEDAQQPAPLIRLGKIESELIEESSGLALCTNVENAIWTHNDSGNPPEVFLLATSGKLLATTKLDGARNIDWEAMCQATVDGKSYLVIGDVGDNEAKRSSYCLYVYPEPHTVTQTNEKTVPTKIEFTYPDGPRNCEAIAFDASTKEIWLIEKRYVDNRQPGQPGIYTLPMRTTSTDRAVVAKRIGDFRVRNVTDMAFSPDGTRLIIRNYLNAHLFVRATGKNWHESVTSEKPVPIALPIQRQGEAICFTADSKSVIVTSEVAGQPIWQVDLESQLNSPSKSSRD